jgi:hypothetical protein
MNIELYITSCDIPHNFASIDTLLKEATAAVSYWGKRTLSFRGYQGSLALDDLANKILDGAAQRCESDDLSRQERVKGLDITWRLSEFYRITQADANWLKKILIKLREYLRFGRYPPRIHVAKDSLMGHYFKGYSRDRFVQEFGGPTEGPLCDERPPECFGPPFRLIAEETTLRYLAY